MGLADEIKRIRAAEGDPLALVGEFRRTAVLVPVVDDVLMSAHYQGIRWIYAFTDEAALARFALVRGSAPDEPWDYERVWGARLLDAVIPALDGPAGVAVDVADAAASMLFPPARGIVPDAVAVDVGHGTAMTPVGEGVR
ncbi:hypothetical protein [Streptomyces coffeae]|uniref:SseB family protein n=1 Tax=Streptomyces coffeae TaxID=621382 RepID=A0ABS1N9B3_9ACTN|nr:hypothetical protein [Streptomyces coffeae]MBL1096658.1 hypothetical protein [Streptomyces coffeae]